MRKKEFMKDTGGKRQFGNMPKVNRPKTRHGAVDVPNQGPKDLPPWMKKKPKMKFADGGAVPFDSDLRGAPAGSLPSGGFNSISSMRPSATFADTNARAAASEGATEVAQEEESFGSAFKRARAKAIKEGRDPDQEIFTWRGQKKKATLAKPAAKAAAPAAKPEAAPRPGPKIEKLGDMENIIVEAKKPTDRERYREAGRGPRPAPRKGPSDADMTRVARSFNRPSSELDAGLMRRSTKTFAKGGMVRGDGCATRGRTKGTMR